MEILNSILLTEKSKDYELLDSGGGEKLERFGGVVLRRPEPQALWKKKLKVEEWSDADAVFSRTGTSGRWKKNEKIKDDWVVKINDLSFSLELLPSKHVGVFPEQSAHWKWLEDKVKSRKLKVESETIQVLNLFGYTGGASLACARAGAGVCHVDSSQFAVDLANKNMKLSGLENRPIRFILDDVRKFIEREIKRGKKYDIVLMDPPVYGKGTKKEVWKIEDDLANLLSRVKNLLSKEPLAIVLNGYASVYSSTTYAELLKSITSDLGGEMSSGDLIIKESKSDRLLTAGIFARWSK